MACLAMTFCKLVPDQLKDFAARGLGKGAYSNHAGPSSQYAE
jgi:hypothetical protein